MTPRDKALFAALFLFLPVIAVGFDWALGTTLLALVVLLAVAWFITLRSLARRRQSPDYELETITMSHFAEKVRWCLDVLGVEYRENTWIGTLGAFYLGRTVPKLSFQTGAVRSSIGNSAEILRYLWGANSDDPAAAFLAPSEERAALEKQIDRAGVSLQIWVYYHILDDKAVALRSWGADDERVPAWQRFMIRLLFPVQRFLIRKSFRINDSSYQRSCHFIGEFLADIDTRVSDGRKSILGDAEPNYTDYAFAAIMGLWLQPQHYGGELGFRSHIEDAMRPRDMQNDIARWREDHPKAVAFVESLYADRLIREAQQA